MYKKIILIAMLLLSSIIMYINPKVTTAASTYSFEQGDQYMPGAYDEQSESPTPYNWNRNSPYYSVKSNPTLKWELIFNEPVRGNPTIGSDGTIYIPSSEGFINAVNNDGTLRWRSVRDGISDRSIDLSTVIGEDRTLYTGNQAFNPDGTLKWVYGTDKIRNHTTALDSLGNVYFTGLQKLYSLDSKGNLNWSYHIAQNNIDYISSPSIGADGTIYIAYTSRIGTAEMLALNTDGTIKWKLEASSKGTFSSSFGGFGAITIGNDGTLYFGLEPDTLYAVNPNGTIKWTYESTEVILPMVTIGIDGSIIFGTMDRHLHALNEDGTLNWKSDPTALPTNSPIVDKNGNIFFITGTNVEAITSTGKHLWSYKLGGISGSSLAIGKDGTIYVASTKKLTAITGDIQRDLNYCEISIDLKNLTEDDLNTQEKINKSRQELDILQSELDKIKNKLDEAESNIKK